MKLLSSNYNCSSPSQNIPTKKDDLASCKLTIGFLSNISTIKWIFIGLISLCIIINIYSIILFLIQKKESPLNKQ